MNHKPKHNFQYVSIPNTTHFRSPLREKVRYISIYLFWTWIFCADTYSHEQGGHSSSTAVSAGSWDSVAVQKNLKFYKNYARKIQFTAPQNPTSYFFNWLTRNLEVLFSPSFSWSEERGLRMWLIMGCSSQSLTESRAAIIWKPVWYSFSE